MNAHKITSISTHGGHYLYVHCACGWSQAQEFKGATSKVHVEKYLRQAMKAHKAQAVAA